MKCHLFLTLTKINSTWPMKMEPLSTMKSLIMARSRNKKKEGKIIMVMICVRMLIIRSHMSNSQSNRSFKCIQVLRLSSRAPMLKLAISHTANNSSSIMAIRVWKTSQASKQQWTRHWRDIKNIIRWWAMRLLPLQRNLHSLLLAVRTSTATALTIAHLLDSLGNNHLRIMKAKTIRIHSIGSTLIITITFNNSNSNNSSNIQQATRELATTSSINQLLPTEELMDTINTTEE
jgi:hypothetical protein